MLRDPHLLMNKAADSVAEVLTMLAPKMIKTYASIFAEEREPSRFFQMLGVDLLVDADLNMQVIEFNQRPSSTIGGE